SRAASASRTVPASMPPAACASMELKRSRAAFLLLARASRRTLSGARIAATSMILLKRAFARSAEAFSRDFPSVVIGELLFVLLDLPIELSDEQVDGGVHVGLDGVGVYRAATHVNRCFGLVL